MKALEKSGAFFINSNPFRSGSIALLFILRSEGDWGNKDYKSALTGIETVKFITKDNV